MSETLLSAEALSATATRRHGIERHLIKDRSQWLGLRQSDVTASVAGALLGIHEYQTAYGLWALKSGLITEDAEETAPMRRGRLLEPVALQLLSELRPTWRVERGQHYFRDSEARIGATPDAFAIDPERKGFGIVQIKTVEPSIFRRKWKSDDEFAAPEPPIWIVIQAIIEAHLTGASWAVVTPLVVGFGLDLPIIEIPIHAELMNILRAKVATFWKRVETKTPPEFDYVKDGKLISRMYGADDGSEVDLSTDNMLPGLAEELAVLKERMKADEKRRTEIENEFKAKIGSASIAYLADRQRVTWKTQSRKGFVVEPTSYRVLRFLKAKG